MKKVLVTGGCGYIGAHTILDLIENNFEPVCIDNNSRSTTALLMGIKDITGKAVKNYKVDLCNFDDTHAVFQENDNIEGIIHFAAFKAVGESVANPLLYFENNLTSLINILKMLQYVSSSPPRAFARCGPTPSIPEFGQVWRFAPTCLKHILSLPRAPATIFFNVIRR